MIYGVYYILLVIDCMEPSDRKYDFDYDFFLYLTSLTLFHCS